MAGRPDIFHPRTLPDPTQMECGRVMKLLADFTEYCQNHPEYRFWQALRNWSGYDKIIAVETTYHQVPEPNPLMLSGYSEQHRDTFYWEGKRHDSPTDSPPESKAETTQATTTQTTVPNTVRIRLTEQEKDLLKRIRGRYAHFCPDWDYLAIDEQSAEFSSCNCGFYL